MIIGTGTDLSYAYYGSDLSGDITLSQIVTKDNVTDMRYMFANCPNIESVTAYEYSYHSTTSYYSNTTYGVEYVDSYNVRYSYDFIFSYTYTYNSVDNFEQVKSGFVKSMSHMFANCYNLTTANLAYMNISDCADMQGMFKNCYNLETVVFGRYACNDLIHTQDIFRGCDRLAYVYVPFEVRHKFGNIIGPAGLHSYYYNANYNIEDTLPEIHITYEITNLQELCKYTTITVNKIGSLIVEEDFPYDNAEMCVLDLYLSYAYSNDKNLVFSYNFTPGVYDVELSDIADKFSYTLTRSSYFTMYADLSKQLFGGKQSLKEISTEISNTEQLGYIDINTYLIYFSDNENATPEHTNVVDAAKSKILLSTDPFFSDVHVNRSINIETFEYEYTYESGFDTYNSYLLVNNRLNDGPEIDVNHLAYVFAYQYPEPLI